MATPIRNPLVLGSEMIQWLDAHRGLRSRNAFITYILRDYRTLVEKGTVTFPEGAA